MVIISFSLSESWLGQLGFALRILVLTSSKRSLKFKIPLSFLSWAFVEYFAKRKMQLECS